MQPEVQLYFDQHFSILTGDIHDISIAVDKGISSLNTKIVSLDNRISSLERHTISTDQTLHDLGEALVTLATHMDHRFNEIDERFKKIDMRFDDLIPAIGKIENHENRLHFLEDRLPRVRM